MYSPASDRDFQPRPSRWPGPHPGHLLGEHPVPLVGRLFVKKMRSFWKHALEPLLSGFWLCYTAFRTPETAQRLRVLYLL